MFIDLLLRQSQPDESRPAYYAISLFEPASLISPSTISQYKNSVNNCLGYLFLGSPAFPRPPIAITFLGVFGRHCNCSLPINKPLLSPAINTLQHRLVLPTPNPCPTQVVLNIDILSGLEKEEQSHKHTGDLSLARCLGHRLF